MCLRAGSTIGRFREGWLCLRALALQGGWWCASEGWRFREACWAALWSRNGKSQLKKMPCHTYKRHMSQPRQTWRAKSGGQRSFDRKKCAPGPKKRLLGGIGPANLRSPSLGSRCLVWWSVRLRISKQRSCCERIIKGRPLGVGCERNSQQPTKGAPW
jgi:hypothetical protein